MTGESARAARPTVRRLLSYLQVYKVQLAVVAALVIVSTLLRLAGPILLGIAIDSYIVAGDAAGLKRIATIMGVVYIVAGAWIIAYPFAGLLSITLLLAAVFLVEGVARVFFALKLKPDKGWGWVVVSGLASILVAFLIWNRWPLSSAYSVGLLAGINFMLSGLSYVMLALSSRKG